MRYTGQLSIEKLEKNYPWLAKCPIHRWRAESGIELIHKEPDEEELDRIWNNWNSMSDEMKKTSDKKSLELFKMSNEDHYHKLKQTYRKGPTMRFTEQYKRIMNEDVAAGYVQDAQVNFDALAQAKNNMNLQAPSEDKEKFDYVLKLTHAYSVAKDEKEKKAVYKEMTDLAKKIKDEDLKRTIEDHLSRMAIDPREEEILGKKVPVPEDDKEVEVAK